jgi:protoheme IX farnesyltransferase
MKRIKEYFSLTKPGVMFGNVITGAAGFFLASNGHLDILLFLATMIGMILVVSSACVINNYFDRDIDAVMERTKTRAIPSGKIKGRDAVLFSIILGVAGLAVLFRYTNFLVVLIGIVGFVVYVFLYGMLSKRLSMHGTLVGSISGAMPILAGYVAARGVIDTGAIIVFLVLFFWQMPEFYSIAVYRRNEYLEAGVPVISVVKGIASTKRQIFLYALAFVISILSLTIFGYTGYVYLIIMLVCGVYWLTIAIEGLHASDDNAWGRKMFRYTLIILLIFCFMISISGATYLP